jgi:hypothetical protein
LEIATTQLTEIRQQYPDIRRSSGELANKWGSSTTYPQRRSRHKKRFFDELAEDVRLLTSEEPFRVTVYLKIVDTAIGQVHWRFQSKKEVFDRFGFLFTKSITSPDMTDAVLIEKA